jgi:hypothetical protein
MVHTWEAKADGFLQVSSRSTWSIWGVPSQSGLHSEILSQKKKKKILAGRWWHLGGRDRWISEFEASLVYKVHSRTARATQRNPVSKPPPPQKKEKVKKKDISTKVQETYRTSGKLD